jgi:hypothetical protein
VTLLLQREENPRALLQLEREQAVVTRAMRVRELVRLTLQEVSPAWLTPVGWCEHAVPRRQFPSQGLALRQAMAGCGAQRCNG